MFPANARVLLLPPEGRGVLLGDGGYSIPVVGKARHCAAIDKLTGGRRIRCIATLSCVNSDYERDAVAVLVRGEEVGFLSWMHGWEFRKGLRKAGYIDAVCKAEITFGRFANETWDYVGVMVDARQPFTFVSSDEWRRQNGLEPGTPPTPPKPQEKLLSNTFRDWMNFRGLRNLSVSASERFKTRVNTKK